MPKQKAKTASYTLKATQAYQSRTRVSAVIIPEVLQERIRKNFSDLLTEGQGLDGITGKTLSRMAEMLCDLVEKSKV